MVNEHPKDSLAAAEIKQRNIAIQKHNLKTILTNKVGIRVRYMEHEASKIHFSVQKTPITILYDDLIIAI